MPVLTAFFISKYFNDHFYVQCLQLLITILPYLTYEIAIQLAGKIA